MVNTVEEDAVGVHDVNDDTKLASLRSVLDQADTAHFDEAFVNLRRKQLRALAMVRSGVTNAAPVVRQ